MSIPVIAYGFLGVEIVAITAFEACDRRSLRWPVRWIAWIMFAIYLWVALPGTILIPWQENWLKPLEPPSAAAQPPRMHERQASIPPKNNACYQSYPFVELAAFRFGSIPAGRYWNACIIYFCVRSANTSLYVASRTLYGLCRPSIPHTQRAQKWWKQCIPRPSQLGTVSPRGVPVAAMLLSAVIWTPLIVARAENLDVSPSDKGKISVNTEQVLMIMTTVGSVGGVMVWAVECFAFIKYFEWLSINQSSLPPHYDRNSRELDWQKKRPFFNSAQPYVAWAGLIGCLLIVFILGSASMWNGHVTVVKVIAAYIGVSRSHTTKYRTAY